MARKFEMEVWFHTIRPNERFYDGQGKRWKRLKKPRLDGANAKSDWKPKKGEGHLFSNFRDQSKVKVRFR
ncbi:hypothetical protein HQ544_00905 [Candidatus Falkowbacteria bacterium]|nr:hypothetical protein [Candidatus Falkowbacteria bacterium]